MKLLNWYGLLFVAVILVPNIVFAATNADGFENKFSNKKLEVLEQIGRFSAFCLCSFPFQDYAKDGCLMGRKTST